ncbi:SPOR domain-containing protein [Actibacterium pelagium]|uniref:SPOR domain-containing protein n=1 Tax=Actibacterium pelagium TaxID=2029103 RepID=A0A917EG99_9RHOB|nr:SPOR domain-containing protein [Actibacterium pelagium]GGE39399.1 hypothetical protein GCM10011517_03860 [Actibacterium pelagium]
MRQTLSVICCLGVIGSGTAMAQSGPAELPPEDFAGRQYIDSMGCIYLRKNSDTGVVWEPRTLSAGEVMCGFAPTFPFLKPKDGSDPLDQVVAVPKTPVETDAPLAEAEPEAEEAPVANPAPVAEMPKPAEPAPKPIKTPVVEPEVVEAEEVEETEEVAVAPEPVEEKASAQTAKAQPEPVLEEALEETDQAQPEPTESVAETPAEPAQPTETVIVAPQPAPVVVPEPKPEAVPQPEAVAGVDWGKGAYLQIAAFRQHENTLKTKAVIEQIGLPVAIDTVQSKGRTLEVVLVGPFADDEALKGALRAVRKAGYKDAFTRRK